jgi:hypothetical protein
MFARISARKRAIIIPARNTAPAYQPDAVDDPLVKLPHKDAIHKKLIAEATEVEYAVLSYGISSL